MNENLLAFYLWNILVNSVLTFVTLFIFGESLLYVCRVKSERVKAICRCLPLLKLPLDLFLYDFSIWALAAGIDPLSAEPGTRYLTAQVAYPNCFLALYPVATGIGLFLSDGSTFTIADVVGLLIGTFWMHTALVLVLIIGLIRLTAKLHLLWHSYHQLQQIKKRATPSTLPIHNLRLAATLQKVGVLLVVSEEVFCVFSTPVGGSTIVLPKNFVDSFSQEEHEAVLAHELEHLRRYDSWMLCALDLTATLFWWIPTRRLLRSVELAQEKACDRATAVYEIGHTVLATARNGSFPPYS